MRDRAPLAGVARSRRAAVRAVARLHRARRLSRHDPPAGGEGENGWPTFPGRSYDDQARILRTMVQAVHEFRGTYNVRDYRWFNLRDSQTGHPGVFQNAGLLEDDRDLDGPEVALLELTGRGR